MSVHPVASLTWGEIKKEKLKKKNEASGKILSWFFPGGYAAPGASVTTVIRDRLTGLWHPNCLGSAACFQYSRRKTSNGERQREEEVFGVIMLGKRINKEPQDPSSPPPPCPSVTSGSV